MKSGDIKIVGETYTDNWDPANAQKEMEQFLTVNDNKVDAVVLRERWHGGGVFRRSRRAGHGRAGSGFAARTVTRRL